MNTEILENQRLETQIVYYQSKLLPFAYNILGDGMAAEDVVQEVLNNYFIKPNDHVEKPGNYLIRAVINKSINQKKLLRSQKEQYPGEWLPAPVFTEESIYSKADQHQILNYSLLVLLERLNPRERAVFILKETFDFRHQEIAEILDIETENSRQILKRAKQKLDQELKKPFPVREESASILRELSEAILKADVEKVKNLLSDDIQSISDGGPNARAARNILRGTHRVYKFLHAIYHKYSPEGATIRFDYVNHHPAIIYSKQGVVFRCLTIEIKEGIIEKIFIIVNPDKLKALNIRP